MENSKFSILISTKNRCEDLIATLNKLKPFFFENVKCVVFDDGSTDATYEKVHSLFPEIELLRNESSRGYIFCRNKMLNETDADFAISLDDDAHFLSETPMETIATYFKENPKCGLIATRVLWKKKEHKFSPSNEISEPVKSFVGCGHIWRMNAWHQIPNYPEWFEFYGEESFASIQLMKKHWEVHYVPQILVQHRVSLKERAKNKSQFAFRYRRSIRADWFNYFLFFPISKIPRNVFYSIWMQHRSKIFKGHFRVMKPLFLASCDLLLAFPKILRHRNAMTSEEYNAYLKLSEAKIYWEPEK